MSLVVWCDGGSLMLIDGIKWPLVQNLTEDFVKERLRWLCFVLYAVRGFMVLLLGSSLTSYAGENLLNITKSN